MSNMKLPTTTLWLGLYTSGVLTMGKYDWMVMGPYETEEAAIGACLSMINVEHIRIVSIPDMMLHGVPDSLQTINNRTGEVVEYGTS